MSVHSLATSDDTERWGRIKDKRDHRGSDWCLEDGIGRQLTKYNRKAAILPFRQVEGVEKALEAARNHAALGLLSRICKECPLACVLARR